MISYPERNYVKKFTREALEKTAGLKLYDGGPGVDYRGAPHSFALSATLLYDPERPPEDIVRHGPSGAAEILLVERASGDGVIGSFSGVTGYIDVLKDPDENARGQFDPIEHTLWKEFSVECSMGRKAFELIKFYAGPPTVEPRSANPNHRITVVPLLGLNAERPKIVVDRKELASYKWVGLKAIKHTERLARGYKDLTLPSTLGAIGLKGAALRSVLG